MTKIKGLSFETKSTHIISIVSCVVFIKQWNDQRREVSGIFSIISWLSITLIPFQHYILAETTTPKLVYAMWLILNVTEMYQLSHVSKYHLYYWKFQDGYYIAHNNHQAVMEIQAEFKYETTNATDNYEEHNYPFDDIKVRVIFLVVYSIVFCSCFIGKLWFIFVRLFTMYGVCFVKKPIFWCSQNTSND